MKENNRQIITGGIIIFAILAIMTGFLIIYISSSLPERELNKFSFFKLLNISIGGIFFIAAAGILRLKNWARILLQLILILHFFIAIYGLQKWARDDYSFDNIRGFISLYVFPMAAALYYFNKKTVKQLFK